MWTSASSPAHHRAHRPSGCGKSTVLRCFNRMNDLIDPPG